jgi:DNA-binding NarL/FixJ family response regulator
MAKKKTARLRQRAAALASPPAKKKVFLVDDHPVLREGLATLINREPDLFVAGQCEEAHDALQDLTRSKFDVAVVDLSLKDGDGLDLVKTLKARRADLPVLVLSSHDESLYGERALRAGARGYIMKRETADKLIAAIRTVLAGGLHASDELKAKMLENYAGGAAKESSPVERLSDRELEVFKWLGHGWGTRQIAEKLCIGVKTVDAYRANIKQKLGLENAPQLIHRAVQWVQESRQPSLLPSSASSARKG